MKTLRDISLCTALLLCSFAANPMKRKRPDTTTQQMVTLELGNGQLAQVDFAAARHAVSIKNIVQDLGGPVPMPDLKIPCHNFSKETLLLAVHCLNSIEAANINGLNVTIYLKEYLENLSPEKHYDLMQIAQYLEIKPLLAMRKDLHQPIKLASNESRIVLDNPEIKQTIMPEILHEQCSPNNINPVSDQLPLELRSIIFLLALNGTSFKERIQSLDTMASVCTFWYNTICGNMQRFEIFVELIWNESADKSMTPLDYAANKGFLALSKSLMTKNPSSRDTKNVTGRTPLASAARVGSYDIVLFLAESGASINVTDNSDQTPLHLAARNGDDKLIGFLVNACENIDIEDALGQTALHLAAQHGNLDAVTVIVSIKLSQGLDKNISSLDTFEKSPLMIAITNNKALVADYLYQKLNEQCPGYGHEKLSSMSEKLKLEALENNHVQIFSFLENKIPTPRESSSLSRSYLLYLMVIKGKNEILKSFLEPFSTEEKITAITQASKSIIAYTLKNERYDTVKILLQAGAPVTGKDLGFIQENCPEDLRKELHARAGLLGKATHFVCCY